MLSVPLCSLQWLGGDAPLRTTRVTPLPVLPALPVLPVLPAQQASHAEDSEDSDDLYRASYVPSWVCVPRRGTLDVLEAMAAPEAPELIAPPPTPEAPELMAPPPLRIESPNAQVWKMPDTESESDATESESDDTESESLPDWPDIPAAQCTGKRKHDETDSDSESDSKRSRLPYFVEFSDGSFAI